MKNKEWKKKHNKKWVWKKIKKMRNWKKKKKKEKVEKWMSTIKKKKEEKLHIKSSNKVRWQFKRL